MTASERRTLSELLQINIDDVGVVGTDEYQIAGVYGFGRGVFARGPIDGSATSYKTLHRLHAGQLVVSRLKAFEGAVAVVPSGFEGWFVSPEFPTFQCIDGELDDRYLAHICRWPEFWSMLAAASRGIGARRERVHASDLLRLELLVPSIDEQRRKADYLDRVQSSALELDRRSSHATDLLGALAVVSAARPDLSDDSRAQEGWRRVRLGSVMTPAQQHVPVEFAGTYPNVGIYSFGRGLFAKSDIDGSATSATVLNRIRVGQFIYSRLFAFEGAYTYVSPEFDGYHVSNEFPAFDTDPECLDARWLANYLRSPERWAELGGASKGLGVRRQRVPVEAVMAYEVWLPTMATQKAILATIDRLDRSRAHRADAERRIISLVPAALNRAFSSLG